MAYDGHQIPHKDDPFREAHVHVFHNGTYDVSDINFAMEYDILDAHSQPAKSVEGCLPVEGNDTLNKSGSNPTGHQPPQSEGLHIDGDKFIQGVGTDTAPYPVDHWYDHPFISYKAPGDIARIYDIVVSCKKSNAKGARLPLQTDLIIEAWIRRCTGHPDDDMVMDGINFGFPLQYRGPPLYTSTPVTSNHHSAKYYPQSIQDYINKEKGLGTLVGPFDSPPFIPWCHVSPLMTRPKSDSNDRRIIVDLSYPDGGVNAYIPKHEINGITAAHSLPTVREAVDLVREMGILTAHLASVDISRAYRNFRTCPGDWPLLIIQHEGQYFLDVAMPFGSRKSSYYMQSVSNFVSRALSALNVTVLIYLDDILVIGHTKAETQNAYDTVLSLLQELGLPVASHKLCPPCRNLVWLGISVDLDNNCLSIPEKKLEEMRSIILNIKDKSYLTVKQMQSLIGIINHLGKTVPPARLFMSRLLESLRAAQGNHICVTPEIRADIRWFELYLKDFNGKAIIPDIIPSIILEADACLTGMGGHDGRAYYTMRVTERMAAAHSISRLECLNVLLAARTLLGPRDAAQTVLVRCDNQATIFTYQYGRAKDAVMLACARAMWLLSATLNINIMYEHVPGTNMHVADALSRIYEHDTSRCKVDEIVAELGLSEMIPRGIDLDYSSFI